MKPGRNDPCPCGSGRKYKQCCLRTAEVSDHDRHWHRVRRALEPLNRDLVREAHRRFGEIGVEEAWDEFFLSDAPGPFDPTSRFMQLFFSWFMYDWLPDPHGTELPVTEHEMTAAQAYLAHDRHVDPIARRYVEASVATPYSFYQVLDLRAGSGFRVRDVMLGTEMDVTERAASNLLSVGDCLFAKLVPIDGLVLLEAVGETAIPPAHKPVLIELRNELGMRGGFFGIETLREFADELRERYLDIDAMLHRRPELTNTDGDPLEMHTLIFDLDAPEDAVLQLTDLGGGIVEPAVERDANGRMVWADITWVRAGNKLHKDWDNTTLGSLHIEGTRLTAEVNSVRRAAALRTLIEQRLGDTAHVKPSVVESVQSLLDREETPQDRAQREREEREQAEFMAKPEVQAALQEMLRSHYRNWIDEQIPALGNRTPRMAVRDPEGREAVEALVMEIERDTARMSPPVDPDIFHELRATLGLDRARDRQSASG